MPCRRSSQARSRDHARRRQGRRARPPHRPGRGLGRRGQRRVLPGPVRCTARPRARVDACPWRVLAGRRAGAVVAMGFGRRPSVAVLDEPTTALDVTTQRHVLGTVRRLCSAYGVAAVYISHDLAVVGSLADTLIVMYAGKVIESGTTAAVFGRPAHPYTRRLLRAIPSPERSEVLQGIEGQPPHPTRRPRGCDFAPRCPLAAPACREGPVPVVSLPGGHLLPCLRTELTPGPDVRAPLGSSPSRPEDRDTQLCVSALSDRYATTA